MTTVIAERGTDMVPQNQVMARPRKKHLQEELTYRTHGGKRPGAGRPPKGRRAGQPHTPRPEHKACNPLHITVRVNQNVGTLRKRDMFRAVREASITTARREDFRIVHASVQGDHIHMMVEAEDKDAISNGMRGFQISAAMHINNALTRRTGCRRRGTVFPDRYHMRVLTSPRAVRHALAYVLNNWRKHGQDRDGLPATWNVDPFSSAVSFWGWREREGAMTLFKPPKEYQALWVWLPKTWLLREGWIRHGLVSTHEVPGPHR
jgi:REP element-mobilizing transposase RayT